MKKSIFTLLAVTLLFGFTSISYCENVVSLKQNLNSVSPQIKVDIDLSGGKGVAGYNGFLIFDATVLKYISASKGDYLINGGIFSGIFMRPLLHEDGSYTLALDVGNATQTGTTVTFGEQQLSLSEFFFEIPSEALEDFSSEIPEVPAAFLHPGAKLWGISILGSAPLNAEGFSIATDGDGTLVTLTFEVINTAHPAFIVLPDVILFGSNDETLPTAYGKKVITSSSQEDKTHPTDVNGDGVVNILDLTRIASVFGQPVTDANRSADVNGDGEINILDLVQVANDFGKSTTTQSEVIIPEEETQHVVVGIALPLTGHLAEVGEIMKTGFELAFNQISNAFGTHISFKYIIADDKGTAEGAVEAFEELIYKQGVSVILGPGSSSSARAAFPVAQENQVVALSATAGARGLSEIGDYVFRLPSKGDVWIANGVRATQAKLGYTRVAQLYDRVDLFSTDRANTFAQTFKAKGVEVATTQTYQTGDTDFPNNLIISKR